MHPNHAKTSPKIAIAPGVPLNTSNPCWVFLGFQPSTIASSDLALGVFFPLGCRWSHLRGRLDQVAGAAFWVHSIRQRHGAGRFHGWTRGWKHLAQPKD